MENLNIKETKYTPLISFNTNGTISMVGKSYPENTFEFYEPILNWMENYFTELPKEITRVNLEIEYFNSGTSKLFFDFFDLLESNKEEHKIEINWIVDEANESAQEAGEEFIEDFENLNIKIVTK